MTLSYDTARCYGAGHWLCGTCRRTEPGDPDRQWMIDPEIKGSDCPNYIPLQMIEAAMSEMEEKPCA